MGYGPANADLNRINNIKNQQCFFFFLLIQEPEVLLSSGKISKSR